MQSIYMLSLPSPHSVPVVCMLRFNIIIAQTRAIQRQEKENSYKCGNRNSQELSTTKGCQKKGPNIQRKPTPSPNPPISLIYPFLCHRNSQEGLHSVSFLSLYGCTYHHRTVVTCPKIDTFNPPPFQPPSLSPTYFHHIRQKYLLCFHGCCQELFTIVDLRLQI